MASYQCVLRLPRKLEAGPYKVPHLSRKITLANLDLMLQNATHLRKSAHWPPDMSDACAACTAPATQNASLQRCRIDCACHTKRTSKSGPNMLCFCHFDVAMCFALQRRVLFQHLNFQKCSETEVFWAFWLETLLHTPQRRVVSDFSSDQMSPHLPL